MNVESNAGWTDLGGQSRKFHYFDSPDAGTRALCGSWMILHEHELQPDTGGASPDDCAACRRKLDARRSA